MINVKSFSKNKGNSTVINAGGIGNTTNVTNVTNEALQLQETHKIWGNDFNGTQDVTGEINATKGANFNNSDINDVGDLNVNGTSHFNDTVAIEGAVNIYDETTIDANLDVNYSLGVGGQSMLKETYPKVNNLYDLGTDKLRWKKLFTTDIDASGDITTNNLTVTGSAHFFELIIDKIKASGGAVIFTPADGFKVEFVYEDNNSYNLYWRSRDNDGNERMNMWEVGDQALCRTFNKATVGVSSYASNKYYWSLVTYIGKTTLSDNNEYHYIKLSKNEYAGELNPEIGDEIVMCGHRLQASDYQNGVPKKSAIARQSAIYISATESLDTGLQAPLYATYQGINDFDLASHRKTYFDATHAEFVGNFKVSDGRTIEEYIGDVIDVEAGGTPYIGDNGHWYIWKDGQYVDSGIVASGSTGNDAEFYRLVPVQELAIVSTDEKETLSVVLRYIVQHIKGNTIEAVTSTYGIRIKDNRSDAVRGRSTQFVNGILTYINQVYLEGYHTTYNDAVTNLTIELYNSINGANSPAIYTASVPVTFNTGVMFSINQELGEIKSTAQSAKTTADAAYSLASSVKQTAEGIEARVSSTETTLTGVTQRLSEVEQTASSITQTVSTLKQRGYLKNKLPYSDFKYNKTAFLGYNDNSYVKIFDNLFSSNILHCSANSNNPYAGIRFGAKNNGQNIKTTVGNKYTISVWVRSSVVGNHDVTIAYYGMGSLTSTTESKSVYYDLVINKTNEWGLYQTTFVAEYEFYSLEMYGRGAGKSFTVDFAQPMMEEAEQYNGYTLSNLDTDIVKGNMLANSDILTINNELIKVNGNVKDFNGNGVKYISCTPLEGIYKDVLEWQLTIKPNTDYVLSFYAKSTNNNGNYIRTHLYNMSTEICSFIEDCQGNTSYSYDGLNDMYVTDKWTKYWVHYKTKNNVPNGTIAKVLFRLMPDQLIDIAAPKLEEGAQITDYTNSNIDSQADLLTNSIIKQTANEIYLGVESDIDGKLQQTGIDITTNKIVAKTNNFSVVNTNNQSTVTIDGVGNLICSSPTASGAKKTSNIAIKPSDQSIVITNDKTKYNEGLNDNGEAFKIYQPNNNSPEVQIEMYGSETNLTMNGDGIEIGSQIKLEGESGEIHCGKLYLNDSYYLQVLNGHLYLNGILIK